MGDHRKDVAAVASAYRPRHRSLRRVARPDARPIQPEARRVFAQAIGIVARRIGLVGRREQQPSRCAQGRAFAADLQHRGQLRAIEQIELGQLAIAVVEARPNPCTVRIGNA
jgi:hypothetical protein